MISVAISHWVSLTNIKILIARFLYRLIKIFYRNDIRTIKRNGIYYEINISEGVDFSLFLFGRFQSDVTKIPGVELKDDAVIVDVGANIGHMTLEFAKSVPNGTVYSFEPTTYAFEKLKKNILLNPSLEKRISLHKALISTESGPPVELQLYSSWKLDERHSNRHHVHGGSPNSTSLVDVISLDDFITNNNIRRLNFIKIDTDGSELKILKGAANSIKRFRPAIVFEIGLYLLEERKIEFQDYQDFFSSIGYNIHLASDLTKINLKNYKTYVPKLGTTDLIAIPNETNR